MTSVENDLIVIVMAGDASYDRGDTLHAFRLYQEMRKKRRAVLLHRGISRLFSGPIPSGQEVASWSHTLRMLAFHTYLFFWFAMKTPKSAIVYGRDWSVALMGILARPVRGFRVVYEVNGLVALQMPLVQSAPVVGLASRLQIFTIRSADHVVTVTDRLRETIAKIAAVEKGGISVVPNAADVETGIPEKNDARRALDVDPESAVVGFVGNLTAWQGVNRLLEAFPIVRSSCQRAILIIVGDGPERSRLEKAANRLGIRNVVKFTGYVPHRIALKYISTFDVAVVPLANRQLYEQTGSSAMKAYEYMACGRPVVAGAFPGLKEEIRESGSGIVVEREDSESIATAITMLLKDAPLALSMGLAGRAYVNRHRSWDAVAAGVDAACAHARNPSRNLAYADDQQVKRRPPR